MVYEFFSQLVNMSMTAGIAVTVVCLLRLPLKKAPKIYSYLLWFIVLFRLLCPVSVPSPVSLMGILDMPVTEEGMIEYFPERAAGQESLSAAQAEALPNVRTGAALPANMQGSQPVSDTVPGMTEDGLSDILLRIGCILWGIGILGMIFYSLISLILLRRKLVGSVEIEENIYQADHIVTPFVIGIFHPQIYLPSGLSGEEREYILLHEKHHIRRCDHIAKIIFYLVLCVYWFNPLVWLAFYLFVKDMEMSCDEAVMAGMAADIRADYSQSLLRLATGRRMITGVPLTFGEGNTGDRIRNILNWKKPKVWVVSAAVMVCAVAAACLLTNPKMEASGGDRENADNGSRGSLSGDMADEITTQDVIVALDGVTYASADEAIDAAIIEYNRQYAVPSDFSCASFVLLSTESCYDDQGAVSGVIYYGVANYKDMDISEEGIRGLVSTRMPIAVTLGGDNIQEALTPDQPSEVTVYREGSNYRVEEFYVPVSISGEEADAIFTEERFPEVIVDDGIDTKICETVQEIDCYAQAAAYAGLDTDAIISDLADYIAAEPLASSAPRDYTQSSPVEYRKLIYYGNATLDYAQRYGQEGNEDLKMAILNCAAEDITAALCGFEWRDGMCIRCGGNTDTENGGGVSDDRADTRELTEEQGLAQMQEQLEEQEEVQEALLQAQIQEQLEEQEEVQEALQQEQAQIQEQLEEQEEARTQVQEERVQEILLQIADTADWPTESSQISQDYGEETRNGSTVFSDHINIAGKEGDGIFAALAGTVETVGFTADYGNYIVILSDNEVRTRYAHLKSADVSEGDEVQAGDTIGQMGKTGRATGSNLHFAVTILGNPVDPFDVLHKEAVE